MEKAVQLALHAKQSYPWLFWEKIDTDTVALKDDILPDDPVSLSLNFVVNTLYSHHSQS